MKLDEWLKAKKMTSAEFARSSGIGNKQAVHKYRHGERFPTPENLRRIHVATEGTVTANDFLDQHAPPESSATPPSHEPVEAAE
jgi:transcriptional regulator with XRE-family HTH domain